MQLTKTHWILIIIVIIVIIAVIWVKRSKTTKAPLNGSESPPSLASPENIIVKPGDGVINVKWDKVKEADFYTLYISETPDFSSKMTKTLGPLPEPKIHIPKLPMGNYWIKINATKMIKGKGFKKIPVESSITEPVNTQLTLCSPPETPVITIKQIEKDIKINWKESYNAEGYTIYVNNDAPVKGNDNDHASIQLGPVTEHLLKDLPEGFEWDIGVKAFAKHSGKSDISNHVKITL